MIEKPRTANTPPTMSYSDWLMLFGIVVYFAGSFIWALGFTAGNFFVQLVGALSALGGAGLFVFAAFERRHAHR